MRITQQKNLLKVTTFLFLLALILLLSYDRGQPFRVLGSFGENLGKLFTTRGRISEFLTSHGPYSPVFFILLQALQVVILPIPGDLIGIVGGYIYGVPFGFFFSTLGLALGSTIAFELARILGKPFVENFVSARLLKKFDFLATGTGATIGCLLFLIPVFPTDVLCFLLGLSRMRLTTFLIISTLGRMPWTFLLTLQGANIKNEQYATAVAIAAVSVVLIFIAYLYRRQLDQWIRRASRTDRQ